MDSFFKKFGDQDVEFCSLNNFNVEDCIYVQLKRIDEVEQSDSGDVLNENLFRLDILNNLLRYYDENNEHNIIYGGILYEQDIPVATLIYSDFLNHKNILFYSAYGKYKKNGAINFLRYVFKL